MAKKHFYGWTLLVVLWAIIILNFAFPTFGMSVVNTYMAKAMHLDRKELGLAYSAFSLMAGLPSPLVGLSINRLGIRLTLVLGTLMAACGALLMATWVHSIPQAVVVLALIVGPGASMAGTMTPQVATARWFHRKRAYAMSMLLTASGIGGFAAVPLLNRIIEGAHGNWRMAWWYMATMSLGAALIAALFVRNSPEQMGQVPDGNLATADAAQPAGSPAPRRAYKTNEEWTLGEVLRSGTLWLLMLTDLGFFMGFFIFVSHGISHLEGLGHTPAAAAKSLSVLMISSLIGQFTVAWLGDRIELRYIFAVAVSLFGIGIALSTRAVGPAALYPYAICMGAGFAASFTCLQTILSNYYGPKAYPLVLGITMPIGTILGAVGPVAAGWFYDRYGTYSQAFFLIAGLCFLSSFVLLLAKPPVRAGAARQVARAPQAT